MATVKVGSIRARKDRPGTYEAVYYVNRQRRRVSAKSREAVSSALADKLKEAEQEPEARVWDRNITLAAYGAGWLQAVAQK